MMKKLVLSGSLLLLRSAVMACAVCEKQQPRILQGITHGSGPESNWDYLIISVTAAIVLVTLVLSIAWLIRPGERSDSHIKQWILKEEYYGR
ncbi:MAG: hypothetical protein U9R46_02575 [Bacteroidota bacterium]|nr:hypothetical protein [Bacteroidota bacterium]